MLILRSEKREKKIRKCCIKSVRQLRKALVLTGAVFIEAKSIPEGLGFFYISQNNKTIILIKVFN